MAAIGSARTGLLSMAKMVSGHGIVSQRPVELTEAALILLVLVADGKIQSVPCSILGMAAIISACAFNSFSTVTRLAVLAMIIP